MMLLCFWSLALSRDMACGKITPVNRGLQCIPHHRFSQYWRRVQDCGMNLTCVGLLHRGIHASVFRAWFRRMKQARSGLTWGSILAYLHIQRFMCEAVMLLLSRSTRLWPDVNGCNFWFTTLSQAAHIVKPLVFAIKGRTSNSAIPKLVILEMSGRLCFALSSHSSCWLPGSRLIGFMTQEQGCDKLRQSCRLARTLGRSKIRWSHPTRSPTHRGAQKLGCLFSQWYGCVPFMDGVGLQPVSSGQKRELHLCWKSCPSTSVMTMMPTRSTAMAGIRGYLPL